MFSGHDDSIITPEEFEAQLAALSPSQKAYYDLLLAPREADAIRELRRLRRDIRRHGLLTRFFPPIRPRGRPKGSSSRKASEDKRAVLYMAIEWCSLKPSEVIRIVLQDPLYTPTPDDYRYLRNALKVGKSYLSRMMEAYPPLTEVKDRLAQLPIVQRKTEGKKLLQAHRTRPLPALRSDWK